MPENPRLEELRRRVESDPASIAFAALAEEYRRLGRYDEAAETCIAGLQRHPAYLSARVTLGRALIETGDLNAAREQFETVLRSAPENLAAIRGLGQIHERLRHSTEMDPHLAQLMREHVEAAAKEPPPATVPVEPQPVHASEPLEPEPQEPLETMELLQALELLESLEPEHAKPDEREPVAPEAVYVAPAPQVPEPRELLEPLEPSEPSLEPLEPSPEPLELLEPLEPSLELLEPSPSPSLAAVSRLERFLEAIQHARHA